MDWCITWAMAGLLLLFSALAWVGGRALAAEAGGEPREPSPCWPAVTMIIPVAGAGPGLDEQLSSLLAQDYPSFRVVLATRSLEDPATPVIISLLRRFPGARHVVAGPAWGCGQKNHNLLAGLKLAQDEDEVLVFCDCGHLAPADLLKCLVRPIASGRARVVSGYHEVFPGDAGIFTLGWAVIVLALHLAKGVRRLNQPWGGATAITREFFEVLKVSGLWARSVSDDVSLAARLKGAGVSVDNGPGATLKTPLAGATLGDLQEWLTRQWLYLKFYLPGSWLAAGLAVYLLAGLIIFSAARLAQFPWISPGNLIQALAFLAALSVLALSIRLLHPAPGPWPAWLVGFGAAVLVGAWLHLKTCFTQTLSWKGISYRIGPGGQVKEVREERK